MCLDQHNQFWLAAKEALNFPQYKRGKPRWRVRVDISGLNGVSETVLVVWNGMTSAEFESGMSQKIDFSQYRHEYRCQMRQFSAKENKYFATSVLFGVHRLQALYERICTSEDGYYTEGYVPYQLEEPESAYPLMTEADEDDEYEHPIDDYTKPRDMTGLDDLFKSCCEAGCQCFGTRKMLKAKLAYCITTWIQEAITDYNTRLVKEMDSNMDNKHKLKRYRAALPSIFNEHFSYKQLIKVHQDLMDVNNKLRDEHLQCGAAEAHIDLYQKEMGAALEKVFTGEGFNNFVAKTSELLRERATEIAKNTVELMEPLKAKLAASDAENLQLKEQVNEASHARIQTLKELSSVKTEFEQYKKTIALMPNFSCQQHRLSAQREKRLKAAEDNLEAMRKENEERKKLLLKVESNLTESMEKQAALRSQNLALTAKLAKTGADLERETRFKNRLQKRLDDLEQEDEKDSSESGSDGDSGSGSDSDNSSGSSSGSSSSSSSSEDEEEETKESTPVIARSMEPIYIPRPRIVAKREAMWLSMCPEGYEDMTERKSVDTATDRNIQKTSEKVTEADQGKLTSRPAFMELNAVRNFGVSPWKNVVPEVPKPAEQSPAKVEPVQKPNETVKEETVSKNGDDAIKREITQAEVEAIMESSQTLRTLKARVSHLEGLNGVNGQQRVAGNAGIILAKMMGFELLKGAITVFILFLCFNIVVQFA